MVHKNLVINARHITHLAPPMSNLGKPNRRNDLRQRLLGLNVLEPGGKCTGMVCMTKTMTRHSVQVDRHHQNHYETGLMRLISDQALGNALLSMTQLPNPTQ